MGSFRSQPDLVKHTQTKNGLGNISYAVSHMCGTPYLTQVGASTWKIHTSVRLPSPTLKTHSSESSMDTEVHSLKFRSLSGCLR